MLLNFSLTTNLPLYPAAVMPLNTNGVSTSNPETASVVVTVIVSLVADPSPALILEIPTDDPVDPTIRNSSIFGCISIDDDGKSGCISLPVAVPYAKPTFS